MKKRLTIVIIWILAFCFVCGSCISRKNVTPSSTVAEELLSGSALRHMMNNAKMSPGTATGYIKDHPSFAWLFDGSFVTYVEEE